MKILSITLYNIKLNLKASILYGGLIGLLTFYMITIFDPEKFAGISEILKNYPKEILEMVGGLEMISFTEIGGFLNIYLFAISWIYFGIFIMVRVSQDLPSEIENRSIDLFLSKPIQRWQYLLGKLFAHLILSLLIMIISALAFLLGIIVNLKVGNINYPYEIFLAFVWLYLLIMCFIAIAFLFSTFLNSKKALALSIGILVILYFLGTFTLQEGFEDAKMISIFYYYKTERLLVMHNMENVIRDMWILFGISMILIFIAIYIYTKRDIPV